MSELEVIHTRPHMADMSVFSPAIRVDSQRDVFFLSGITAYPVRADSKGAENFVMPDSFNEQARLAIRNIDTVLTEIGVGKENILKIANFYTDDFNLDEMQKYLDGWKPCSSAIGVNALPVKGAKIMYELVVAGPA